MLRLSVNLHDLCEGARIAAIRRTLRHQCEELILERSRLELDRYVACAQILQIGQWAYRADLSRDPTEIDVTGRFPVFAKGLEELCASMLKRCNDDGSVL